MNWEEVEENSPKALKQAEFSLKTIDHPSMKGYGRIERERDLYDFFDQHGVRCFIVDGQSPEDKFGWSILIGANGFHLPEDQVHFSRKEAEDDMFSYAFEKLEEQLN